MASVFDIAQFINIQFGRLSKIKLQILLYFSQGWFLALHKKELFPEDFFAWKNGPVVKELDESMRDDENFVPIEITSSNIKILSEEEYVHVNKIIFEYGDLSKEELVELSHKDSAWSNTPLNTIISKKSINDCYEKKECPEILK